MYLIYVYKEDLALNNLQWLISHKTRPNQTKLDVFASLLRKLELELQVFCMGLNTSSHI